MTSEKGSGVSSNIKDYEYPTFLYDMIDFLYDLRIVDDEVSCTMYGIVANRRVEYNIWRYSDTSVSSY